MLHYPIAREELVAPYKERLEHYGLSSSSIHSHLSSLRRLFVFMEDNDIALYEPPIGNLYLNVVWADPTIALPLKQKTRATITLLNNELEGKEYCRAKTKDLSYHWEGTIGKHAEDFLKYLEKD